MLMAPLESPLTRVEDDLKREALELFIMVGRPSINSPLKHQSLIDLELPQFFTVAF